MITSPLKIELIEGTGRFHTIVVNGVRTDKVMGGSGGYRAIGSLNGFIYKADYVFYEGEYPWFGDFQTAKEIAFYPTIEPQDKKYFAEILQHGKYCYDGHSFSWLQEKLEDFKDSSDLLLDSVRASIYENKVKPLVEKYKLEDISTHHNWGIKGGEPFIYDYAGNPAENYK